jgi:hypothetical protein
LLLVKLLLFSSFPFSFFPFNYCNSNSCHSSLILKAITISFLVFFAITFKSKKDQKLLLLLCFDEQ